MHDLDAALLPQDVIAHIDARGRRYRLRLGVVGLVAAAALTLTASVLGWPAGMRLPIAVVWFGGYMGVFQARAKT